MIQSSGDVPIIASERVAYFNGTAWSSFAEMMGLPQSQLSITFFFPWYNEADLRGGHLVAVDLSNSNLVQANITNAQP